MPIRQVDIGESVSFDTVMNMFEGRNCWSCNHLLADDGNYCQCPGNNYNTRIERPVTTTCREWEKPECD